MFSLPRENTAREVEYQGYKSFLPGRNITKVPFIQYTSDGAKKKEYLPHKSSDPDSTVFDEAKLLNWGNK